MLALGIAVAALAVALYAAYEATDARRERRQHAREREQLLDRIMHLADKTWTPPPSDVFEPPAQPDPDAGRYVAVPEQLPDNFEWGDGRP